jgi:hypothetical protein
MLLKVHLSFDLYPLFEFIFTLQKKKGRGGCSIRGMELQVKLTENVISKYHIREERLLGKSPETAPPTSMNTPHYPSYIAAIVSKQNPCWRCVTCYKKGQRRETLYN